MNAEPSRNPPARDPDLYRAFERRQWAALHPAVPMPLHADEVEQLRGVNEPMPPDEVTTIYVPLAHLLHLHVVAAQQRDRAAAAFLRSPPALTPFVIGITGSVAVGKSTTARLLQALLARRPEHPSVALVTTDSFLFPNAILEERRLMRRKGFPETYDHGRMFRFIADIRRGRPEVQAPIYSHLHYDILPNEDQTVRQPDILIMEGLSLLHHGHADGAQDVTDLLDLAIYLDADESHIADWYIQRFLRLRETAFQNPASFFHRFTSLDLPQAITTARGFWDDINGVNLREHVAPTRQRANIILEKGSTHHIQRVLLRTF